MSGQCESHTTTHTEPERGNREATRKTREGEDTKHRSQEKNTRSWASMPTRQGSPVNKWSQGNPFNIPQATRPSATNLVAQLGDSRRTRELLVRVKDREERKRIGETSEEILKELKDTQQQGQDVAQLKSALGLRSGDLLVQTTMIEARERLEKDTTWLTRRYPSAEVIHKVYPVIVFSSRPFSSSIHI